MSSDVRTAVAHTTQKYQGYGTSMYIRFLSEPSDITQIPV